MTSVPSKSVRHTALVRGGWIIVIALGSVSLYFVLINHAAHVYTLLPFLLLGACPLMHLFHRHGHGHRDAAEPSSQPTSSSDTPREHHDHKS